MLHQSLVSYIRAQMANGAKLPDITGVLLQTGWSETDINEAFAHIQSPSVHTIAQPAEIKVPVVKEKKKPKISFSSSRMGVVVLMLVFSLTIGAIFLYYFQNQHNVQTASTVSLPPEIR